MANMSVEIVAGNEKRSVEIDASKQENTGFSTGIMPICKAGDVAGADKPAAVAAEWITPALIEKTDSVWSKRYGRRLERSEILDILQNVRRFGQLLLRTMKGEMA